jgi:hypothetical protein
VVGGVVVLAGGGVGLYFLLREPDKPRLAGGPGSPGGPRQGGNPTPQPSGYATPQALFDAVVAAEKKKDFKTLVDSLTPEALNEMASQMAVFGMMQQAAPKAPGKDKDKPQDKPSPVLAVMDKHGLSSEVTKKIKVDFTPEGMEKAQREVGKLIKEPAAFTTDMLAASEQKDGPKKPPAQEEDPKLTDLKVNGDKATGTVVRKVAGKEVKEPVEFVKVGGGWKLNPRPKQKDAPKPPKPPG